MHQAVLDYVRQWATDEPIKILDIGGRDVNGTPRHLFPNAEYLSVDLLDGPGVDLVGDVMDLPIPMGRFDIVLCLEVFEHCRVWPLLVGKAAYSVRPGGRVVFTCAGDGREPHSGVHGGPMLYPGEWYANVRMGPLIAHMARQGLVGIEPSNGLTDLRATAVRPLERS